MKYFLHILFLFLISFTNTVNATSVFLKISNKNLTAQLGVFFIVANDNDLSVLYRTFKTLTTDLIKVKSSYPNTATTWNFSYDIPAQKDPLTNLSLQASSYSLKYPVVAFPIVIGGFSGTEVDLGRINESFAKHGEYTGVKLKLHNGHALYPLEIGTNGMITVSQNYR